MFDRIASYFSADGAVQHVLHLLQSEGATALDSVRTLLAGIKAFTGRDMAGVFAALAKEQADVSEILAAVKAEFGTP